ncbi:sulfotransferase [Gymnodinialimonas ulvae]|uniref:sulfotransferase n=1 Tax=Gymnodinialimonas ulvae TaxID=3126504 RepID=UPI0030A85D1F
MPPIDLTALYREGQALQQAGRLAEAAAIYDRILSLKADIPEVLFQKARCLPDDPPAAERLFREALSLKPKEAAIWQGLYSVLSGSARAKLEAQAARAGVLIGSERDLAKAQRLWRDGNKAAAEAEAVRLTKAAPQAFWPMYMLGLIREGAAAIAPLEAAHARDKTHVGARLALARAALATGQIARVDVLLAAPDLPPAATVLRAQALRETAQPDAAVALLSDGPEKDRVWQMELALAAAAAFRGAKAQAALRHAVTAGAPMEAIARRVASAAETAGDIETATALIEAALAHTSTPALLIHRAQMAQSSGELAQAEVDLEAALAAEPTNGEAFRAFANGRKITPEAALPGRIAEALEKAGAATMDRAGLHFAAAKCASDLAQHSAVMDHLHRANRLMTKAFPYSFEADVAAAKALVDEWGALGPLAPESPEGRVIFVTGLPRSGTTLVETILDAHPQVGAGGEMPFLGQALAPSRDLLRRENRADPRALQQAGDRYLTLARRRTGTPDVIVDKAISTFSRMGHAVRALPEARIVHVTRDPRDVGLSLYRNRFPDGLHRYAYDLTAMGRYIRLHDAVTAFWRAALPGQVHTIRYEELTADPETQIRALLEAVDLPWDAACLAPQNNARRIQTLSFAQARAPIARSSVAGWTLHAADLQPLFDALEMPVSLE